MELNQEQAIQAPPAPITQESSFAKASEDKQILLEILENSRKTRNYTKWQLYITLVLVVLPLLAMIALVPMVMKSMESLGSIYGAGGLLQ